MVRSATGGKREIRVSVSWDYSDRAHTYDKRADYSVDAVVAAVKAMGLTRGSRVADIGAGTGKLSKILLEFGLDVLAVEPNANMRQYGVANTAGRSIAWSNGTGEETGIQDSSVSACFFGSSFNVLRQDDALQEVSRITTPSGWFGCMWNHRDLDDPLQSRIEQTILSVLPSYDYGTRRQDPTQVLRGSNLFGGVVKIESRFEVEMTRSDVVDAWRSHETLSRQAGNRFNELVGRIEGLIDTTTVSVPYFTRIWIAQLSE